MKDFEFAGLKFSTGNGINDFAIDISISQYHKFCQARGIDLPEKGLPGSGANMIPICLNKIFSNNWRRMHGLKMFRKRGAKNERAKNKTGAS